MKWLAKWYAAWQEAEARKDKELSAIEEMMLAAHTGPTPETLAYWQASYPQYAREIKRFWRFWRHMRRMD